jgi:serine protease Do
MKKYILVSLISISLTGLFFISQNSIAQQNRTGSLPQQPLPTLKLGDPMPGNLFVELAKAINPCVVNISTSAVIKRGPKDPMQEMLERFYGIPSDDNGNAWNDNKPRRIGLGTGFIIRDDGLIVTNAHVIRDADIIEVQLTEGSEKQYKAEVVGSDQRTDIALIKIKPDVKLSVASLGTSKDLQIGEWVAAFGNPYGHGHTMTKGVISSKGRAIQEINKFPLLQTDASINPGNSGGPLVNSKGQVIGINSAIDARAQGIGFAIPIDEVKSVITQLENGGIKKGFLGIGQQDLDDQTAAYLNFDDEYRGSVVVGVQPGSPADQGGIKIYDVIFEIDGQKVKNAQDLSDIISDKKPGQKVQIKLYRNNKGQAVEKDLMVTIAKKPSEKTLLQRSRRSRQGN